MCIAVEGTDGVFWQCRSGNNSAALCCAGMLAFRSSTGTADLTACTAALHATKGSRQQKNKPANPSASLAGMHASASQASRPDLCER